jgi:radical SAM protein (TIGR04043 family)
MLTRGVHFLAEAETGREGGAGPTLGRYFLIDEKVVVNAPVRSSQKANEFHSLALKPIGENRFKINNLDNDVFEVTLVPIPHFYQKKLDDGTPMSHIALIHGIDCLATTIVQHCDYFNEGLECLYCSIPVSLELGRTIFRKSPEQFLQVLLAAQQEGCASHLTLTIGSPKRPDRGALDYIDFVSKLRQHSDVPIHVQLEPPDSTDSFHALKEAGVDTVGIHLEIYDDALRKKFCPGKFQHASFADYLAAWRSAVNIFGRGQVSTFILLGFGETAEQLHQGFKTTIKTGVIPVPVPYRPNPGSHLENHIPNYVNKLKQIVDIYLDCAQLLHEYKLDPSIHRAGCIRCRGCTAIQEAYEVIKTR